MVVFWKRGDNMPIPIKSFIFSKFGMFQNIPVFEKSQQKYSGFLFGGGNEN